MRRIEKDILKAIQSGVNWKNANTQVVIDYDGTAEVYLHGNHIANMQTGNPLARPIVNETTLRRYPTVTTKSRLRALGANVTQEKNKIYLDGQYIRTIMG